MDWSLGCVTDHERAMNVGTNESSSLCLTVFTVQPPFLALVAQLSGTCEDVLSVSGGASWHSSRLHCRLDAETKFQPQAFAVRRRKALNVGMNERLSLCLAEFTACLSRAALLCAAHVWCSRG